MEEGPKPPPEVSQGRYKQVFGVLYHLTKLVNSGIPLPELLRSVASAAANLVGAQSCSIMLLDDGRSELLSKAAFGLSLDEEQRIRFRMGEGVAGWVAEHGAPALIADAAADPRFIQVPGQPTEIRAILCVPLTTREGVIGTLSATSDRVGAFGRDHEELLSYLGASIVKDIENARLYRLSITDALTKAYNRQYLYQRLPEEIERSNRYGDALSIVLFDVDFFKLLNDQHGHAAGDFVLKELVRIGTTTLRDADGLVRYGGEEFLALLPKTELAGATQSAERLRAAIGASELPWSNVRLRVTASFGVAQLRSGELTDEALLKRADTALLEAKSTGRNRVLTSPNP
jgi:diguanylate cyclase (GGDEF)-like protein